MNDTIVGYNYNSPSVRLAKLTVQFDARYNSTDNCICKLFKL